VKAALLSDEARADVLETFAFYEARSAGLGVRFREHLDHAIDRIVEDPERYPTVYRGLRRRLVERFPYAVYYRAYPETIFIVAVMHGRRSPARWKSRAPADDE
jgi:toxin ParE1/3/4